MLSSQDIKELTTCINILEAAAIALDIAIAKIAEDSDCCYHLSNTRQYISKADSELRFALNMERRSGCFFTHLCEDRRYLDPLINGTEY